MFMLWLGGCEGDSIRNKLKWLLKSEVNYSYKAQLIPLPFLFTVKVFVVVRIYYNLPFQKSWQQKHRTSYVSFS